ncbi:MAG: AzlC family ABC transporter permease [Sphaerochaetaceae bacterium]
MFNFQVIKRAFITTIPVLMGYSVLGLAFGLLIQKAGYNWIWALFSSLFVYAGSMQFVLVSLLINQVPLATVVVTTLLVNSRHLFYGLSFIEKFKGLDKRRYYMIFSLTDETYALLTTLSYRGYKENEDDLMLAIAFLNQLYWITGSTLGAVLGSFVPFNTDGIEFAMAALFVVIVVEQFLANVNRKSTLIGFVCAITALMIFGPNQFLIAALGAVVIILLLLKPILGEKR